MCDTIFPRFTHLGSRHRYSCYDSDTTGCDISGAGAVSCSRCPLGLLKRAHASSASAMQQRRNIHWQWPEWNTLVSSYNPRGSFYCDEKVCLYRLNSTSSPLWNGILDFVCFSNHTEFIPQWLYPSKPTLTGHHQATLLENNSDADDYLIWWDKELHNILKAVTGACDLTLTCWGEHCS